MGRREIINLFYRIHGKIEIIFGLSYLLNLKGWTQSNGIELVVQSSSGFKGRLWTWNDQNRTIRFEVLSDSNMKIHLIVRLLSFQELNKMNCQHTFAIDPNEMGIRCLLEDIPCSNEDFRALTIHTVWPISQGKLRLTRMWHKLWLIWTIIKTSLFRDVGRQCKEEIKTGRASFGFADSKFGDALPSKTRIRPSGFKSSVNVFW